MRDLIDEKNKRDKMKGSIIKRWNVNYMEAGTVDTKEEKNDADYNATTGSYSGAYGKGQVEGEAEGQINMILREKEEKLRDIIDKEIKA